MTGNQLSLADIINISVAASQAGIGDYNTSNLALFTSEAYSSATFGILGYKIYLDPTGVATDFGTGSIAFAQANAIFSQQPNILAGGGYLVIIPIQPLVEDLALSGVAASGTFELVFPGGTTAAINWNDLAPAIQTKVQAVTGQSNTLVSGSIATRDLKLTHLGLYGTEAAVTVTANSLATSGPVSITFTITIGTAAEDLASAITRTKGLVQFFGIMGDLIFSQADMLAAAAVVQPLNKIAFFVSRTSADVAPAGLLDLLRSGGFTQSRGLYYGGITDQEALVMMASYSGRALSTNFNGSNTTSTMQLKDLTGVQPDPSITETLFAQCKTAGADVYASFQGVAKVFSTGANSFFDDIYNEQWIIGAMQVAVFNYLAQSATKIPQTEQGMDGLKGAIRKVCDQAVTNQYLAPGQWNSSTTFGNQADFFANIKQAGYYIYSQPIAQQSQSARAARQAPLVQIALKEAGAIHSSSVIIYINA